MCLSEDSDDQSVCEEDFEIESVNAQLKMPEQKSAKKRCQSA